MFDERDLGRGLFAVASRGVFVIPTLSVLYSACGRPDGPSFLKEADTMKYVKPQFRGLVEMPPAESKLSCDAAPQGIRQLIAAKVPVLAGTDSPSPGLTYGASLHQRADLLLVDGDPSKQIRNTRKIVAIWKLGVRVQRAP